MKLQQLPPIASPGFGTSPEKTFRPNHIAVLMRPMCSVHGCNNTAEFEVILYDVYPYREIGVFFERHDSCPFICQTHLTENEKHAETEFQDSSLRRYRGVVDYPYTKSDAQGFVVYRPLSQTNSPAEPGDDDSEEAEPIYVGGVTG